MNIKQELEKAIKILKENNITEPMLKSKIILADILKQNKEYLLVHEKEELDINVINIYEKNILKLCSGIPVQYITHKQEFMGLEFYVDKNVLIPQPDTEILVEEVIYICKSYNEHEEFMNHKNIKILDLCTGSGAIGISIARNIQNSEVTLLDISKEALNVAEKNYSDIVGANDPVCPIKIVQSDLFEKIDVNRKFDIIVSNPPYIKTDVIKTLDIEVQNEPILALDGGKDGLEIYTKIVEQAHKYLKPNGYLCLEIGYDQKEEVIDLIEKTRRYTNIYSRKDLAGNNRIIICKNKEN